MVWDITLWIARQIEKKKSRLESVEEHVAVMGGLSIAIASHSARHTSTSPEMLKKISRCTKAWRKGNTDALWAGDSRLRKQAPGSRGAVVDNRNIKWVSKDRSGMKKPVSRRRLSRARCISRSK